MRQLLALGMLLVALGGCRSDKSTVSSGTTGSTSPSTSTSTTASTLPAFTGGGTTAVSTPVTPKRYLTGIRVGRQNGFDRIVFEFDNAAEPPGYQVSYVNRPVQEDGSGKPVTITGDSVLEIHMESASGVDLSGGKVTPTYTGPKRLTPSGPAVVEMAEAGDFEGVLRWVAGVKGHPPFVVSTLTGPGRLVIDVAAAP